MLPGFTDISVNGICLAYRERGRGKTTVPVHGSRAGTDMFRRQAPAFSRHHRVVTCARQHLSAAFSRRPGADHCMYASDPEEDTHAVLEFI